MHSNCEANHPWIGPKSLVNILWTSTQTPVVMELAKSPYKAMIMIHKASEVKQREYGGVLTTIRESHRVTSWPSWVKLAHTPVQIHVFSEYKRSLVSRKRHLG